LYVRKRAAGAIVKIGGEGALPGLLKALEDEDLSVRKQAAEAIGEIGGEGALPGLLKALEDQDLDVREQAAGAIGQIGSATALPTLWQHHLKTPEDYLKKAIQTLQNKNKLYNYDISQTPLPASLSPTDRTTTINNFNAPVGQVNTGTVTIHGNNIGTQNNLEKSHE
jgi:hypothetical protein